MTMEDKVFARMRFDRGRMEGFGFAPVDGGGYSLERDFLDGDFRAEIMVNSSGKVRGRVIDMMNEEEYTQLRNPNYCGAFVGTVRDAYEKLLREIAAGCCGEVAFAMDQSNRITAWIEGEYGVSPDFPWDDSRYGSSGVFRHTGSGKWFGLIMDISRKALDASAPDEAVDVINLKINAADGEELRREPGIYPAYHMNHRLWITVLLDDTLPDSRLRELIDSSFRLTSGARPVMDDALVRRVLEIADSVPRGKVATYGQIARLAGRENNSRLIGRIMSMADRYGEHPCHRVVNHAGRTVPGWEEQRSMLEAEGVTFRENGCVDMDTNRWEK